MRMTWSDLLFAHWPIDPKVIAPLLPPGLTLDTRSGTAWIGVVPFLMSDVAPRCCPAVPKLSRFLELNVRTYVTCGDKPGVWFFSLDAESRIAVRAARATFNLPYMDATMSAGHDTAGAIDYQSERTHRGEAAAKFDATYRSDSEPFYAEPGTLEHWLTARYCLYTANRKGKVYRGEIDHAPWLLSKAICSIRQNTLGQSSGFDFQAAPHLLAAAPVAVRAWLPTRCEVA